MTTLADLKAQHPINAAHAEIDSLISQLTAEREAHEVTRKALAEADGALVQHGYHQQGIPELDVPHCGYDPETGTACDCGFQPLLEAALARQAQRAADAAKEE